MHKFNLQDFIKSTLTDVECHLLFEELAIQDDNQRLLAVRNFFLTHSIFQKTSVSADPMWIANQVYVQTNLH